MKPLPLKSEIDVEEIRLLLLELGDSCSIGDFEEHIQMKTVRETIRLWRDGDGLVGFGYVDDYCNLWFETKFEANPPALEDEIIDWGCRCLQLRNKVSGTNDTLDHCCNSVNIHRQVLLLKNGFVQGSVRSLTFSRPLVESVEIHPFPPGYSWRPVNNLDSIESLVELHQAAFGTENMTVEYRRAMMNAPQYHTDLDLVAVAPDGSLCAFCICGFYDDSKITGYIDPIGTHPHHLHKGVAKALVSKGMAILSKLGAQKVEFGTSSENAAMRQLAASLGFTCTAEKLWFSKEITPD
jgi:ribosomal protein S18 acetylase RimI-like enzyme